MDKVTIILTSFNHEKYICECIESVLKQTHENFELIIWDDASTDKSSELISSYKDKRIRVYRNEYRRRGIYGINKIISECEDNSFIAIHHSDDVWKETKLEKQIEFLHQNQNYGAVFTNAQAIDEDGRDLEDETKFYTTIFNQHNRSRFEWLGFFFLNQNALCHPSLLIRKICYTQCGLYRYGFGQLGDLDMWVRLCLKYEIHILHEKLVKFRVRKNEENTSGNKLDARSRLSIEFYEILKNYLQINSFDELASVFKKAEQYRRDDYSNIDFALSMILLDKEYTPIHWLLGLDILFQSLNSPEKAEIFKNVYNFDYMNYIELTKNFSIVNRSLAEHEEEISRINELLANVYDTESSKLTKLLRLIGHVFKA